MDGREGETFKFGAFRLNLEEKILLRDGEIVPLTAKVIDVLSVLVKSRGAVVSRDELMNAVWPESFVEESNLTQSIYTLRRTLGNFDGKPIIETLPKRGYRMTVAVDHLTQSAPDEQLSKDASSVFIRHRSLFAIALVGFFFTLAAVAALKFAMSPVAAPVENVQFEKLTFSGDITFPVISPDGHLFAYVRDNSIFLQDIMSGSAIRLNIDGHKKFGNLQFSADGDSIYFRNEDSFDAGGEIFQVSRLGGTARSVAQKVWSTVGFSPDGSQMAFVRFFPTDGEWSVFVKDTRSGNERKLYGCRLPRSIFRSGFPAWSPDGSQIALVEQTGEQQNASALLIVDVISGAAERLTTPNLIQIEQVTWLPESRGILITGRENNRFFQLWKMELPGENLKRITNDLNIYRSISISADGQRLLTRSFSTYSHIWTISSSDLQEQRQITSGNMSRDGSAGLAWTPDGKVIYATRITGNVDLWSLDPADDSRRQLTENAGTNNEAPFVTADGRYVFFESTRTGKRRIWRMNADGSDQIQISPEGDGTAYFPVVSPDGLSLFYVERHPRSNILWRQSLVDGSRADLSGGSNIVPGSFAAISDDGRYLAVKNQKEDSVTDQFEIAIFDLASPENVRLISVPSQNPGIMFTNRGTTFDYIDNQPNVSRLWRQSLNKIGERKMLLEITGDRIFAFSWSNDERTLALSRGRQESDAMLLRGF